MAYQFVVAVHVVFFVAYKCRLRSICVIVFCVFAVELYEKA